MRSELGTAFLSAAILLACGGEPGARTIPGAPTTDPSGAPAAASAAQPATAPLPTCPTDVPASSKVADVGAADLALVLGDVWLRDGADVGHVAKTGGAITKVYTSPDLVRAYVDASGIFSVESPNPPDAVLRFVSLDGTVLQTVTPDGWNAGGTRVFGSDATSVYVLADAAGDAIYRVDRTTGAITLLADLDDTLSDPQMAGEDVWFVRDRKRVYKVAQTDVDGALTSQPATEIFASGTDECHLAVGDGSAYCSTGKALVRRDLTGGGLTTLFDVANDANDASARGLGAPIFAGKALVMRPLTDAADAPLKNVISALVPKTTSADQKIAACGRPAILAVAADATSVVWSEKGGVFVAPR